MLDTKQLGKNVAALRKQQNLSQEKLGEMLCISPQAISKWENGHTVPETSLLPVLAQIFNCTIDEIIMPAYSADMAEKTKKASILEQQEEHIAKYVLQQLDDTRQEQRSGLDNDTIISAVRRYYPNVGNCEIVMGKPEKHERYTSQYITVESPQKSFKLVEKVYHTHDRELRMYDLLSRYTTAIPKIYAVDSEREILLMEDLNDDIQGFQFDEENEMGKIFRKNYPVIMKELAKFHAALWKNEEAFGQIGLDWRHEAKENLLAHISGMEKDFVKYRAAEEEGKIPKIWNGMINRIASVKFEYFQKAIECMRTEYIPLLDERFYTGNNITVVHGDLHPGHVFLSKEASPAVRLIDMEAVRVGLCTEDLAMLLALHIAPDKGEAQPLLNCYYGCLSEYVKGYSYEQFMRDYKLAIMESMFFVVRLINQGIYDFDMRDRAMKAYEDFCI